MASEGWRTRLLDPEKFAALARALGLGFFTEDDIHGLWRIGLLRADLVSSDATIDLDGLLQVRPMVDTGSFDYCDIRTIKHRPGGYGSSFGEAAPSNDWRLGFHPHRLFVLHHVQRTLRLETSNTQFLVYEDGVRKVIERRIESARRWTASVEFGERFDYWNKVAEIAIVSEPVSFVVAQLGGESSLASSVPRSTYERLVLQFMVEQGQQPIRQMREDLAFAAETLDENRAVHVLLRLMRPHERDRLQGRLGAAMNLLAAAETIRRAAETALGIRLPEEDEIGPGQWFPGARKMLYGSDRVFDAPRQALRDYLSHLGLDFAIKVRCYVEGATEMGALKHAVGAFGHVQLIDLKGKIAERGGKGLAFADSLDADKRTGVFSVVLLDGDRSEYVRLVRRAAEKERFTGSFFIAIPDFELGNFSAQELVDVAVSRSGLSTSEPDAAAYARSALSSATHSIRGNNDLFALLAERGISDVKKDEAWGKALMEKAITQPLFGAEDARAGTKRPVVAAVEVIIRMQDVGFLRSLAREKVDSVTGRAVPRVGGDD